MIDDSKLTVGERVKKIRKTLKLSQTDFGEILGLSDKAISKMENRDDSVTDRNINMICKEFDVSYAYLKDGIGEMFLNTSDVLIKQMKDIHHLDDLETLLVKEFLDLPAGNRKVIIEYLKKVFVKEEDG